MNVSLSDPAFLSRLQFGFTLAYYYLFPKLTMGLAWFLVYWKWRALKIGDTQGYYQIDHFHGTNGDRRVHNAVSARTRNYPQLLNRAMFCIALLLLSWPEIVSSGFFWGC